MNGINRLSLQISVNSLHLSIINGITRLMIDGVNRLIHGPNRLVDGVNWLMLVSCGTNLIVGQLWHEAYFWLAVARVSFWVSCGTNLIGRISELSKKQNNRIDLDVLLPEDLWILNLSSTWLIFFSQMMHFLLPDDLFFDQSICDSSMRSENFVLTR